MTTLPNEQKNIGNKNTEYQSPDTELKFLEALVKEDKVISNNSNNNTFKITKGAFNKAMTYAKAIGQIAGTGIECYGYLLKPADSLDNVVTDIFLAPNQTNQAAYVRVSAEGVYQSSQEIEPRGLMMVGWWHSHGTFSTFHSGTDVHNFETVLHSIAPRTLYKNEKGQYTYNEDTKELMINGAKIKGVSIPTDAQIEVIRKVEQDPYAYSMVVNMRRDYYLEKITKTLVSKELGFKLNPPVRPTLELVNVANDVKYTISEIEDDITSKVEINSGFNAFSNSYTGSYWTPKKTTFVNYPSNIIKKNNKNNKYEETIFNFADKLTNGIPDYLVEFVDGLMKQEKSVLSKLNSSPSKDDTKDNIKDNGGVLTKDKQVDLVDLCVLLSDRLENVSDKYSLAKSYDINRLREELILHFIHSYSTEPTIDVVNKFARINSNVSNNFDIAVNAGKSLAKYSMERFTDYNSECKHKYKNFIGHFLDSMNTNNYSSLSSGFKFGESSKYDKATDKLFLYEDRLKIINNMFTTLTFKSEELKLKPFLMDFAEEYQKNPASEKLDSIIEQKLFSVMGVTGNNLESYVDRTSYERKGIIGKIFGEVKDYFGGAKNARQY